MLSLLRLLCGYIYATAGEGESTQDVVYGGQNLIAENGTILAESRRFVNGIIYADLDIHRLDNERRRMTTCQFAPDLAPEGQDISYNELCLLLKEKKQNLPANLIPDHLYRA